MKIIGQASYRSGPLPRADELKKYAEISPQVLETILSMAEKQQKHRHNVEFRQQKITTFQISLGQFLGFLIAISIIAAGTFLLYNDKNLSGFALLLGGGASLIGVYMYGKKQSGKLKDSSNENHHLEDNSEIGRSK